MISHKIAVHQLIDVCTSAVGRPTNLYLLKTSPKYSNDFYYIFYTELSHVAQERAEGPKAPSPGHRPGYNGNQQGAL